MMIIFRKKGLILADLKKFDEALAVFNQILEMIKITEMLFKT